ncbi:tetratricopeptide repeat protein [Catenovulum sediminis]|uniref:SEL1-like repeat protein n=1 Tax=Catenovulum sediminis TaxID=1740262 RepID=A0ABV1RFN7_9ALTE|nr:SEL1-like repeat protein [Catenovulum sediminis]
MIRPLIFLFILINSFSVTANIIKANQAIEDEDFQQAAQFLLRSAKVGHAESQFKLAIMNFQGQIGKKDLHEAMSWLFLASQYDYPNALKFTQEIYASLPAEQQQKALKLAEARALEFGPDNLQQTILPHIGDSAFAGQVLDKSAKLVKRGPLHYTGAARRSVANEALFYKALQSGNANLLKQMQNFESGMVITIADIDSSGNVEDVEVIFEWPEHQFTDASIDSVYNSVVSPAKRGEDHAAHYGLVFSAYFGSEGVNDLRTDYPHLYKTFRSLQRQAEENPMSAYYYANFLRAYRPLLSAEEYESFEKVLLGSAEQGILIAQLAYGVYQVYENDELQDGMQWIVKAAQAGFAPAEYRLGDLLMHSPSAYLQQDFQKAQFWLTRAAEQGHEAAQKKLETVKQLIAKR